MAKRLAFMNATRIEWLEDTFECCLRRFLMLLVAFSAMRASVSATPRCETVVGLSCRAEQSMAVYTPVKQSQSASADWFMSHGVSASPWKRSVALLVGVSDYDNYERLQFVQKNIQEIRNFLLLEERFDEVDILQDRDAGPQILDNLMVNVLPKKLGPDDRFLFYYAGHGSDVGAGVGYMIFSGYPPKGRGYDSTQALDVEATKRWAQVIKTKHALFLLDGCALGLGLTSQSINAGTKTTIQRLTNDPSRVIYSASRNAESTYGVQGQLSYFAEALLATLRDPKTDSTNTGLMDILGISSAMGSRLAQKPLPIDGNVEWFNKSPIRPLPAFPGTFFFLNTRIGATLAINSVPTSTNVPVRQDLSTTNISPAAGAIDNVVDEAEITRMQFVKIQPGSFMMGCSPGDISCLDREKPAHEVRITKVFEIGKYEVTQAQWQTVMGTNPSRFKGDNLPVESISWSDVQLFINRLNDLHDGYRYRLPTEAEWEYMARAGTSGASVASLNVTSWYSENSGDQTHPVGQKQPNAWGIYDTLGNVQEFVQDWIDEKYYASSPANDPPGPSVTLDGDTFQAHVLRGGGFSSTSPYIRLSWRARFSLNDGYGGGTVRNFDTGLRCVRESLGQ